MNWRRGCSPPRRGGVAAPSKKCCEATFEGADGVVSPGERFKKQHLPKMTTPSAPLRLLRVFFLLAQPPLLFKEGNALFLQFIHTFFGPRPVRPRIKPV